MKKIIIAILLLFTLTGCELFGSTNETTTLQDVLSEVIYDVYESKATFSMTSTGESNGYIEFEYTVSESNDFIKTKKTINDDVETNIIYKSNDVYYLYQEKNNEVNTVQLLDDHATSLYSQILAERDSYYTSLTTDVTNYTSTEDGVLTLLKYSEILNDVYYDTVFSFNTINKRFVSLEKTFTKNNTINKTKLEISYVIDTTIPGGNN